MKAAGRTLLLAALVVAAGASAAQAKITSYPDLRATPLGRAMADNPREVRKAVFSVVPPGQPGAVSTTRLAGFPRHGRSFAILSNGAARDVARDNDEPNWGDGLGGPFLRGARDVTILRVFLNVPSNARCLSIRFRFLSEEFPEFVDSDFNDAFIAELDGSTWMAGSNEAPGIVSPRNFATDAQGNPIRINAVGDAAVDDKFARGTTFDAGTRILRASTPITPGRHSLYLSIFDQGDRQYDSAVLLDRLSLDRRSPCRSGAVPD